MFQKPAGKRVSRYKKAEEKQDTFVDERSEGACFFGLATGIRTCE